jgi:drug/metabolite transporter (DMT)-like permease
MTPASNVSIIMLLETILGPLWVWAFISESPQLLTIIGGAIVILALVYFFSIKLTEMA